MAEPDFRLFVREDGLANGLCINMSLVETFEPGGDNSTLFTMASGSQKAVDVPYVDIGAAIVSAIKVPLA